MNSIAFSVVLEANEFNMIFTDIFSIVFLRIYTEYFNMILAVVLFSLEFTLNMWKIAFPL